MILKASILSLSLLVAGTVQARTMDVVATAYCSCKICTSKSPGDKGYGITASGLAVRPGMIAVDKRVIPLGTRVKISNKWYLAGDTGSWIKGKRIDIYFERHSDASKFGRKKMRIEF